MAVDNNNSVRGIGVILTIIALITGVASIVTPMKDQIASIEKNQTSLENRLDKKILSLDDETQKNIENNARLDERVKNIIVQINKLEEEYKRIQEEILNLNKEQGVK